MMVVAASFQSLGGSWALFTYFTAMSFTGDVPPATPPPCGRAPPFGARTRLPRRRQIPADNCKPKPNSIRHSTQVKKHGKGQGHDRIQTHFLFLSYPSPIPHPPSILNMNRGPLPKTATVMIKTRGGEATYSSVFLWHFV